MTEKPRRKTNRARELRNQATPAGKALWGQLSARKLLDVRFNRQVCIGPYICDFVSRSRKLVVEVDGETHAFSEEADASRTTLLRREGYRVIRFWNNDVLGNLEGVLVEIERVLKDMPSPNPSRERKGD